jgi:acetaldehyde dehydrogenase
MKVKAAILGTGNIGSDLLLKIIAKSDELEVGMFAGIDADSEGIKRAKVMGVPVSAEGISAILEDPSIQIVFDATSAKAHLQHAPLLKQAGKAVVDMTPAAVGPYYVPAVGMKLETFHAANINMVTCGGQGAIPMVYAVSSVCKVVYAETVSTISSASAGPGTRANIDEFTVTTAKAVRDIGGSERSKSIIILNPATPPIMAQNTIYAELESEPDQDAILKSVYEMVSQVQRYVPGYRLKYEPIFDEKRVTIIVEVEGAGDYLPKYAGNLDIMTSSAMAAGEDIAKQLKNGVISR